MLSTSPFAKVKIILPSNYALAVKEDYCALLALRGPCLVLEICPVVELVSCNVMDASQRIIPCDSIPSVSSCTKEDGANCSTGYPVGKMRGSSMRPTDTPCPISLLGSVADSCPLSRLKHGIPTAWFSVYQGPAGTPVDGLYVLLDLVDLPRPIAPGSGSVGNSHSMESIMLDESSRCQ